MSETTPGPDGGGQPSPRAGATPGEVRLRRSLERPPSARFQADRGATSGRPEGDEPLVRGVVGAGRARTAIGIAAAGAVAIALLNAILAVTVGLVAVAGVTGYLIGLALRGPSPGRGAPGLIAGTNGAVLAILLALVAVAAGAIGAWLVAIPQGNLLGPVDYLGQTLGVVLPIQAVVAAVGAWLGSR